MPIGSIVELEFAVPGKDAGVHAFGLVRWVSEPPLVRGMGVQFVEVDAVGVETLRAYVQNKDGGE